MVDDTSKSSAALYKAIQGATNEGILVIDLRGQVISYNDQFLEIWDIPKNFAEHADDSKLLSYVQDKLLNWDKFLDLVNHLYDHPGEERTNDLIALKSGKILSRNTKPVRTVDGEIIARAWNFADVSKIATASAELEGSEKRYRTLFESAPVGMVVISQKIILFANQKFTNMVGYNDPQTIIGLEIGQFQP
ncbi:MAG: PAS domain-containing protein, partial [Candidatus Heimdallarchaeota archaeon]|nr:PAS domain-containing protein [Candidatus Heimdallarchaeota archaeon]